MRGIGGVKSFVKVFPDAFTFFLNVPGTIMTLFGVGRRKREYNILHRFCGLARPAEMILVLGRPGSGCTTFLKVIANQRFGYTRLDGEVRYGPFDSNTFGKKFRGEAVYNSEDEVCLPLLPDHRGRSYLDRTTILHLPWARRSASQSTPKRRVRDGTG